MIGVLVPAYNAQASVGEVVARALRRVPRVLVVDDGSTDATADRAVAAGAEVLRHEVNRGKGAALRTGFARWLEEGADAVVTLDADLQHDPEDIPLLVDAFERGGADLVIGSREAGFDRMRPGRRFGNRFSCMALRFFSGLDLPDSQSGFRLHSAAFLRALSLRRCAYDTEMEVLLNAAKRRLRVETVAIKVGAVDGKATSYFRPWLDTYRICRTVIWFSVCQY